MSYETLVTLTRVTEEIVVWSLVIPTTYCLYRFMKEIRLLTKKLWGNL